MIFRICARQGGSVERKAMINPEHKLSIRRQSELLDICRSTVYYRPRQMSDADLMLMRRIDELHMNHPFSGSRMLRDLLSLQGLEVGRRHVQQSGSILPKSAAGQAISYTLNCWEKLTRFIDHPVIELSTNWAENSMRPISRAILSYVARSTDVN